MKLDSCTTFDPPFLPMFDGMDWQTSTSPRRIQQRPPGNTVENTNNHYRPIYQFADSPEMSTSLNEVELECEKTFTNNKTSTSWKQEDRCDLPAERSGNTWVNTNLDGLYDSPPYIHVFKNSEGAWCMSPATAAEKPLIFNALGPKPPQPFPLYTDVMNMPNIMSSDLKVLDRCKTYLSKDAEQYECKMENSSKHTMLSSGKLRFLDTEESVGVESQGCDTCFSEGRFQTGAASINGPFLEVNHRQCNDYGGVHWESLTERTEMSTQGGNNLQQKLSDTSSTNCIESLCIDDTRFSQNKFTFEIEKHSVKPPAVENDSGLELNAISSCDSSLQLIDELLDVEQQSNKEMIEPYYNLQLSQSTSSTGTCHLSRVDGVSENEESVIDYETEDFQNLGDSGSMCEQLHNDNDFGEKSVSNFFDGLEGKWKNESGCKQPTFSGSGEWEQNEGISNGGEDDQSFVMSTILLESSSTKDLIDCSTNVCPYLDQNTKYNSPKVALAVDAVKEGKRLACSHNKVVSRGRLVEKLRSPARRNTAVANTCSSLQTSFWLNTHRPFSSRSLPGKKSEGVQALPAKDSETAIDMCCLFNEEGDLKCGSSTWPGSQSLKVLEDLYLQDLNPCNTYGCEKVIGSMPRRISSPSYRQHCSEPLSNLSVDSYVIDYDHYDEFDKTTQGNTFGTRGKVDLGVTCREKHFGAPYIYGISADAFSQHETQQIQQGEISEMISSAFVSHNTTPGSFRLMAGEQSSALSTTLKPSKNCSFGDTASTLVAAQNSLSSKQLNIHNCSFLSAERVVNRHESQNSLTQPNLHTQEDSASPGCIVGASLFHEQNKIETLKDCGKWSCDQQPDVPFDSVPFSLAIPTRTVKSVDSSTASSFHVKTLMADYLHLVASPPVVLLSTTPETQQQEEHVMLVANNIQVETSLVAARHSVAMMPSLTCFPHLPVNPIQSNGFIFGIPPQGFLIPPPSNQRKYRFCKIFVTNSRCKCQSHNI